MPGGVCKVNPSPFMLAILLATLPVRYWPALEERFPVHRAAWLSGLVAMLAGFAIGIPGFIAYAWETAGQTTDVFMAAHGDDVLLPGSGMAALPVFLLTTPLGLFSLYLTGSGFLRAVAAYVADDPRGDFVLTAIDTSVRRLVGGHRSARARAAREALEGPEMRDRLVRGAQLGRPDVALVLLSSRAKDGWAPGAYLVGGDGAAHRIGMPFDVETPAGLRTAYPLSPLTTLEPIRHAIAYELPRQRASPSTDPDGAA